MDNCNTSGNESSAKCSTQGIEIHCYLILNSNSQKIIIAMLCIITGAFCILENITVLSLIFTSAHLRRKPSFLFIVSLASADLLASLIFVYSFVDFHVFHGAGTPGVFLFKLGGVTLAFTASLGSLLLTAFDRYICIHKPSAYKVIVTRRRAIWALSTMWLGTMIISYLPLMGVNCCGLDSTCSELFPLIDHKYLGSWIALTIILLCSIIFSYIHIFWKAHKHTVYMARHAIQAANRQKCTRLDFRLAKTLALVLTVLVVCWTPTLVLMIYSLMFPLDRKIKTVFAYISTLCLVNSMVNPAIYALRTRELRKRLLRYLHKLRCIKRPETTSDNERAQKHVGSDTTCEDTVCNTELSV
ncbi:cannabinoid receptor 2 [Gastrophryne carolinensis]